jgi:hypothetical protein
VIETFSTIRVLSSDDVAFRLNGNGNETGNADVVQQTSGDGPSICVTLTNTSGAYAKKLFLSVIYGFSH